MKVIVYEPKGEEEKAELARRVATVHAEAVLHRLSSLSCPKNKIDEIFDDIMLSKDKPKSRKREANER